MKFRLIENKILKESEQPEHLYYVANSKYNGEFIPQEEGHHFCTTLEDAINILPQLSKTKDSIYQYDLIKPLEPMVSDFDFTYWCGPIIAEFLIYKIQDKTYTFPDGITVVPPSAFHIDTLVPEDIDVLLPIAQLEHETVESFDEIMKFLAEKGFNSIEYHPMENNVANIAYLLPNDIENYVANKQLVWQKDDEIIIESAQNGIEYDNEGNQLTPEQSEFFKNSKVRDEQGRLLVCYHGSRNEGRFDVFDKKFSTNGFFFTTKTRYNNTTSYYSDGDVNRVYKCYLNIENPQIIYRPSDEQEVKDLAGDGAIVYTAEDWDQSYYNYFDDKLEDNVLRKGEIIEIIAFSSKQIKSITNKTPTNSDNINEGIKIK